MGVMDELDPVADPFVTERDVVGLYPPNVAAVAAVTSYSNVPQRDGSTEREPDD
jgi:hypothetical protein